MKSSIEEFKLKSEVEQIGIVLHFLSKHNLQVNIYPNTIEVCWVKPDEQTLIYLKSLEHLNLVENISLEKGRGNYYQLIELPNTNSSFQGYKAAIIETITFLNTTKFINE